MKTQIYLFPGFMTNEKLWSKLTPFFDDTFEFIHIEIPNKNSLSEIVDTLAANFENKK